MYSVHTGQRAGLTLSALTVLCHYKLQTCRCRSSGMEPSVLIVAEPRDSIALLRNRSANDTVSDVSM